MRAGKAAENATIMEPSLTIPKNSPPFQCFNGLYWALALLCPPVFASGRNVPGSAVLCLKTDTPGLGVGVSTDPSVWVLACRAFSATPFSVTSQSVAPGVSLMEVIDWDVTAGGMEEGEELVLALGFAQMKLHHWARAGEERRKETARARWKAPILLLCLAWTVQMIQLTVAMKHYTCAHRQDTVLQLWQDAHGQSCKVCKSKSRRSRGVKIFKEQLSACPCPSVCCFFFLSLLFFSSLVTSSLSLSVLCPLALFVTPWHLSLFLPLPPLLSLCVITDSPSSGTLQQSTLDFLSFGQIRELVSPLHRPSPPPFSSFFLLHLLLSSLSSLPICVACILWVILVICWSVPHATCLAHQPLHRIRIRCITNNAAGATMSTIKHLKGHTWLILKRDIIFSSNTQVMRHDEPNITHLRVSHLSWAVQWLEFGDISWLVP